MKRLILFASLIASPVFAQAPQQQQQFVPIILDPIRFNDFYAELRKIPMPADAHERIAKLLDALERQAQQEKAQEVK